MIKGMEFGLYTLGDHIPAQHTGQRISAGERIYEIIGMAQLAEQAGIDFFSIGKSHQKYFTKQAHTIVLAAIAKVKKKTKISSSFTIISTSDPVHVYKDFTTIVLISKRCAEIIADRASHIGLFELLGYDIRYYEEFYEEKFDLLLPVNEKEKVDRNGRFRAPLKEVEVIPHPQSGSLPTWRALGEHPARAVKAERAGVPADRLKRNIDLIGTEILPAIWKCTAKKWIG